MDRNKFLSPETLGEIAYVIKGFPRLSETFIANEIYLLESMGMKLRLYSVKHGDAMVHDVVGRIRAPLAYLPEMTSLSEDSLFGWLTKNLPAYAATQRLVFARRPLAYVKTLGRALVMTWKYRGGTVTGLRTMFIKEFLQAGYIAAQVLGAPTVCHLHGHFCHGATTITWFASLLTGLPFSFTAHAKDIYQADLNPGDLLSRKMQAARFVVTCTGANYQHLVKHHPQCKVVHTVYHGLDTDYFAPQTDPTSPDLPTILSVGRFVEKKGFAYLVEACAKLKAIGVGFRCVIVGEKGDQSARIAAMVAELGLSDCVLLRGPMTQEELRKMYRQATLFALPCLITEDGDRDGIPNVLAEAMAMGLPAVSTPISGIPELVRDGIEGLLVPQKDSVALADAMAKLLKEPALRANLARAAREQICHCFDSRKTTQQLMELFLAAMLGRAVVVG